VAAARSRRARPAGIRARRSSGTTWLQVTRGEISRKRLAQFAQVFYGCFGFLSASARRARRLDPDPVADGSGHVKFGSDRIDDRALRRLFDALERHHPLQRHHHGLVLGGSHSRRPHRRYENLLVAAEVDRLQRACLSRMTGSEGGRSEVESVLIAGIERKLERHERASKRLRWLPGMLRRRAEARARKRFDAIVTAGMAEVGGEVPATMILGQSVAKKPPFRASAQAGSPESQREPELEPAAEPSRCMPAPAPEPTRDEAPPSRDRDSKGLHADIAWAVGVFAFLAAVLAWTGVPLGEDAPVGSRVIVDKTAAPPATAFESTTLALLHEASADDARPSDGDAQARGRDAGRVPESAEDAAVETAIPTDVNVDTSVPVAAPMPDHAPPAPAPSPAPDGRTDDGGAPESPRVDGGGGQASPVRGELVDEMLGRP
jgi:hypothetical protein